MNNAAFENLIKQGSFKVASQIIVHAILT